MPSTRKPVLVSAAIVSILAALLAGVLLTLPRWRKGAHQASADREEHTRAVLAQLAAGVLRYRADQGALPPDDESSTALVVYLDGDAANGGPDRSYFEFEPMDRFDLRYMDLWREAYLYRREGDGFVVWSTRGRQKDPSGFIEVRSPVEESRSRRVEE